jgi:hypothetical protein
MPGAPPSRRVGLALLLAVAPLCAAVAELTTSHAESLRPGESRWEVAGAAGLIRIVIDRSQQRAFVYRGEILVGVSTVSTGKKGHVTPLGTFTILQKAARHRSNKYSNAPMPFMQRLTWDGIALHAGPLPGYPASHGCIRLPWSFAKKLFAETTLGVIVEVTDGRPPLPPVQMAGADEPKGPDVPQLALVVPAPSDDIATAQRSTLTPAVQPTVATKPPVPVAAPSRTAAPVVLAMAEPPRPAAPARPPRATWQEQSADDFVTWGGVPPARSGSAGSR